MEIPSSGLFTGNKDVLTKEQWRELYPQSDYSVRSNYALHFLIAYGNNITQYVGKLKEKNPERLKQGDPRNENLTPLHIATMKASTAVAELLLDTCQSAEQKKKMINAKDNKGWTPLHHAAVTSASLFRRFLELGGNPNIKVNSGMDCNELLILSGRATDIRSKETLFVVDPDSSELILLANASEVLKEKIFGKEFFFTDSIIFSPDKFHKIWNDKDVNSSIFTPFYEKSKRAPPTLIIDKCQELLYISPSALECRAKAKIPYGTFISEYTGRKEELGRMVAFIDNFSEKSIYEMEYSLEGIEARNAGNEARFFNWGFPNAVTMPISVNGQARYFLISTEDIEAGEAILYDYGIDMSHLAFGTQVLLGKEKMVAFFQKNEKTLVKKLLEIEIEKMSQSKCTTAKMLENLAFEGPVYYVLGCPTALLYLHFSNVVNFAYWSFGLEEGMFDGWQKRHATDTIYLRIIFETLKKLEDKNEFKNAISQWVLQKLEKISVIHIVKGLELLVDQLNVKSLDELELILKEIDLFLSTYDWKNDLENYPFNFESMAECLISHYKRQPKDIVINALKNAQKTLNKNSDAYKINEIILKKI